MTHFLLESLLEASIRAMVVAGAVALVLATLRVLAGATRHAAWTGATLAMLAMPLLTFILPPIPVALPFLETPPWLGSGRATPATLKTFAPGVPGVVPKAPPVAPAALPFPWPLALALAWGLGTGALLIRTWTGAFAARRLRQRSARLSPGDFEFWPRATKVIAESPDVATPVSVGLVSPLILLPADWRRWSADTLVAVLVHENAHVRRRDPLVGIVAVLNRAIFWFHPLAWWLENAVTSAAEEACDDEAVRALGNPGRYAQVLLEMARAARHKGGCVTWAGSGVGGRTTVERRIRRLLGGGALGEPRLRSLAALAACATVIVAAAASRPAIDPEPRDEAADLASAEAQLLRAKERAPGSDASTRLGEFYGAAIVGTVVERGRHIEARPPISSAFSSTARRRLEDAGDDVLLLAAARYIDRAPTPLPWALPEDRDRLVQACVDRALELNPRSTRAQVFRVDLIKRERRQRIDRSILAKVPLAAQKRVVLALPDGERFDVVPELAAIEYSRAKSAASSDLPSLRTYVRLSRAAARSFAGEALSLSTRFRGTPFCGAAVHRAHLTLGLLALDDGDRPAAVDHLLRAASAPVSPELTYAEDVEVGELAQRLLDAGEREAVAEALERTARVNVVRRSDLLAWARAARRGGAPRLLTPPSDGDGPG
jgi:BlaR1 peptidase M56